jgi:alpha-aminoadipic semialdehyde synthase
MQKIIGIRREDKNQWERRVPLIPEHVRFLKEKHGIHTIVQPSANRIFTDDEFRAAGAEINEDLGKAQTIFAVKEIPIELFEEGKTYIFFSHTIKGQAYNMDMLRRMKELKVNLFDYERFVDNNNRRLIFFGRYAGLAGMIETLHAYGQKMKLLGYDTPFARVKQAYEYPSLEAAKQEIAQIGREIDENGFGEDISPLVVGFTGYGNVSQGAQEIFDLLPYKAMSPHILSEMYENFTLDHFNLYKVIFKEEDLVRSKAGTFDLQDYYNHPEKYESRFEEYIQYLQMLVNCIYWTEDYPRLVTREYLKNQTLLRSNLNLKVIGDISCDIDGSIEITHKATMPDTPNFTYFADKDTFEDGVQRLGVTVMAVDNLPCEFSREASTEFSEVLKDYVDNIASQNYDNGFGQLNLDTPSAKALILQKGEFTEDYNYMKDYLK